MRTMPPDPAPWIARPAISMDPLLAPPHIPLPKVKIAIINRKTHLRPKMLHSCPNKGAKAVLSIIISHWHYEETQTRQKRKPRSKSSGSFGDSVGDESCNSPMVSRSPPE